MFWIVLDCLYPEIIYTFAGQCGYNLDKVNCTSSLFSLPKPFALEVNLLYVALFPSLSVIQFCMINQLLPFPFEVLGSSKKSKFHSLISGFLCIYIFQALDTLLELSASSNEQPNGYYESTSGEDMQYLLESSENVC